jgi:hypothetical protein
MDNISKFKIGTLTRKKYNHYYNNNIESKWTPIEPIIKDIRVGKSQSFIITKIQFPIQLTTSKITYRSQGLSLNELVFDPTNVKKHGLTYITLSHIRTKEKLILLALFQHEIFYVDPKVHVEMNRLKTIATWIPLIPQLKNLHNFHVIIQTLNTTFSRKHFEDINHDHNLQMSHILCLIETTIHHASTNVYKFINSLKYSYISIHDGHGLMMMYNIHMHLDSFNAIISNGSKYITIIFNINT